MIKVHTKPGCVFCIKLKEELIKLGVEYEEVNVGYSGGAVPRVYDGDKLIFKGLPKKQLLHDYFGGK